MGKGEGKGGEKLRRLLLHREKKFLFYIYDVITWEYFLKRSSIHYLCPYERELFRTNVQPFGGSPCAQCTLCVLYFVQIPILRREIHSESEDPLHNPTGSLLQILASYRF